MTPRRVLRHLMVRDLIADPAPAAWEAAPGPPLVTFAPLEGRPDALAPLWAAAYPPGHPDHVRGEVPAEYLDAILSGREVGPVLPASRLALAGGIPVGAAIITAAPPRHAWEGGAFVADLFRDPASAFRGTGGALLRRAVVAAAAAGAPRMGLSVTDGHGARRLYEGLGFEVVESRESVQAAIR